MRGFVRAFAVILLLAAPPALTVSGCSAKQAAEQTRNTREELLRTERLWQLTLGIIQVLKEKGLIVPNSEIARKLSASIAIVELAMDKWRAAPDDVSVKQFAKDTIKAVKAIVEEVRA